MVLSEPCIPWEYGSNKYESQKGMGAFGQLRDTSEENFRICAKS